MGQLLSFDFDDTLFFTDHTIFKSYRDAIKDVIGTDLLKWKEWQILHRGRYYRDFLNDLQIDPQHFDEINQIKKGYYVYHFGDIIPNRGLLHKAIDNKADGGENVIVTNATSKTVMDVLKYFNIDPKTFGIIIDRNYKDEDGNVRCKPDPYLYKLLFYKYMSKFKSVTVYEDSASGLQSVSQAINDFRKMIVKWKFNVDIRIVDMYEDRT